MYSATKQVIQEIAAALAAAAFRDYESTGSPESKLNRADLVRLPAITKAVMDMFGHFKLKLVEYNHQTRMGRVNYFVFDCVVRIDDTSCVMKGELSLGGRPYSIGFVRYDFEDDIWHRVKFSASGRVSEIAQVEPFKPASQIADDVTSFLSEFLDKEEQNRNIAMTGNNAPGKPQEPLTQQAKANLYRDYLNAYNKKKAITPTEQL